MNSLSSPSTLDVNMITVIPAFFNRSRTLRGIPFPVPRESTVPFQSKYDGLREVGPILRFLNHIYDCFVFFVCVITSAYCSPTCSLHLTIPPIVNHFRL